MNPIDYLTVDEYQLFTGEEISLGKLVRYSLQFNGLIKPNMWMINQWMETHEEYPLEVKMAVVVYIQFSEDNANILNKIPMGGSTVGSTSVDYINTVGSNFGELKYRVPRAVAEILKPTNLLSINGWHGRKSGLRLIGTEYSPAQPKGEMVGVTSKTSRIHDMDTLLDDMPSIEMVIHKLKAVQESNVRTSVEEFEEAYRVKGWFRDNKFGTDSRTTVIISPQDTNTREFIDIKVGDRFSFVVQGKTEVYTIRGFDKHLDYNAEVHHYLITGE